MELKLKTDGIEALRNSANKHYDEMMRSIQAYCPHELVSYSRHPITKKIVGANCLICGKTLNENTLSIKK